MSSRIRELNDRFRRTGAGGRTVVTRGVSARGADFVRRALHAVRTFERFTEGNDPYGEHDFGAFELDGQRLFWKLDYLDENLEYGAADPADPETTTRVLTIMLAEEY